MAEEKPKLAEFYKVHAGFTSTLGVAQEGQVVRGRDMVAAEDWEPMDPEEQQSHFGRLLYEPYEPEEGDVIEGEPLGTGSEIHDSPIAPQEQNDAQREMLEQTDPSAVRPQQRQTTTEGRTVESPTQQPRRKE